MKKLILSASFAFALLTTSNTFAQQGFGTNQPNKSAAVDIVSSKRGLLIPRISIADLDQAAPVHQPAHSLFVFNTNATTGQGFYYWEKANPTSDVDFSGKWVRFTSSINEKDVIVAAGENVKVNPTISGLTTTYTVGIQGGTEGQVLVSNATGGTVWVNPEEFVKDVINATNGLTYVPSTGVGVDNIIKLGGALTENTVISTVSGETNPLDNRSLTIAGLETVAIAPFVMVMNDVGLLQKMERSTLLDAKDLTLGDGLAFETGNGTGAVLIETKIEIEDKKVKAEKLLAENPTGVTDPLAGKVATADANGNVTYEAITPASLRDKKALKGDGITVTAGTTVGTGSVVAEALLADVTLGIADGAVTNQKLADGAVSPDKMTSFTDDNGTTAPAVAGHVPVADGSGNVTYQNVATAIGQDLTTDGKIVIGNNTSTTQTLADAVLVATQLSIAAESITSGDIKDGTIQVNDIKAPGTTTDSSTGGTANQVMVTDQNGSVTWVNQSDLGNKDNYNFSLPLSKDLGTANSTGGKDYSVSIATATGTTLGVVKEAATPTVNINAAGELAVNLTNTVLVGDVTGPLNATKVEKIQGTAVSATPPDATNNVLKYVEGTGGAAGQWVPSQLQGTDVAGKAITSTSLTVSADGATAALKDVTINITPGTAVGQILTTVNTAAAGDPAALATDWTTVNSLVEVDNGLKKVTDVIHLGGALKEVTEIAANATNTLAISGLQPATETVANKVVVSEGATGILRTVERVVEGTNANVVSNADYSFYTPEVVLNITLPTTGDVNVVFPDADKAVGQVINIKIVNTGDTHTGYLNVLDTYGSMPYQGWIVKSNGNAWVIVGRN
ncbi:hypothetical protein [Macellibacteroides fermentans]|uniref:hypothetical protein n=1 Tax=Macellibacteroides fermentans TaxID=879969 RepID=UPI00406D3F6D